MACMAAAAASAAASAASSRLPAALGSENSGGAVSSEAATKMEPWRLPPGLGSGLIMVRRSDWGSGSWLEDPFREEVLEDGGFAAAAGETGPLVRTASCGERREGGRAGAAAESRDGMFKSDSSSTSSSSSEDVEELT